MTVTLRPVDLPADADALLRLQTGFTTDRILRVEATAQGFRLVEQGVAPPLAKEFSLDEELGADRLWSHGWVAQEGARLVGFAALRLEEWNGRGVLWHLYVDRMARGRGIGRHLLAQVSHTAHALGANRLWLEVTNVNVPAIAFYRKHGFVLCGLDQSLYDPTGAAADETALFFAKALP